jgi:hypothetical protein
LGINLNYSGIYFQISNDLIVRKKFLSFKWIKFSHDIVYERQNCENISHRSHLS